MFETEVGLCPVRDLRPQLLVIKHFKVALNFSCNSFKLLKIQSDKSILFFRT